MTIDEAVALIRSRGFVANVRRDLAHLGHGPECIMAAKQTVVDPVLTVLDPTRFIVRDGAGWATLQSSGQMIPKTFIPASYHRESYATLDDAVAAVLTVLAAA